jgi:hypothetical protein
MNESMNIQQTPKTEESDFEKIKVDIAKKLETAERNPLDVNRYQELEKQIADQKDKFFKEGIRSPEDLELDDKIKQEILSHGAIVKTVPEYGEMLDQVASQYSLGKEWRDDLLAHENAHANVSQQLGYDEIGYGLFFISEEEENSDPRNIAPKKKNLISIQPAHIHEDPAHWPPIEVIENGIRTLEAPEKYGNEMSEADIAERDELIKRKEEVQALAETKRQQDLAEVRKSLGIN